VVDGSLTTEVWLVQVSALFSGSMFTDELIVGDFEITFAESVAIASEFDGILSKCFESGTKMLGKVCFIVLHR
jgi:hypothetical protein